MLEHIQQYFQQSYSIHLVNAAIAFMIVMIIGFFVKYFLKTVGRKLISITKTEFDDKILHVILPRIKWLAIVIGLYLALEEAAKGFDHTDKTGLQLIQYAEGIVYIVFVTLITLLIIRLSDTALQFFIHRHAQNASSGLDDAVLPLFNRLSMILIFFIAVVIGLEHFGVNVSSLLVFLGGGSVAIALAAQETLANMIAGFVIMIDRPFRVGDRVKLPSGEVGDVYEIGIRSTKILDFDHNLIVSPNSDLTKAKVINFSYPHNEIRVLVEVSIGYGTSIERARELMLKFARQQPELLKEPAPEVIFSAMSESSCTLQLIARTDDWKKKGRAETALREQIYSAFMKEGISTGYAKHVIQISPPPPNVNS